MSRAADWTFRIERTSYKSADLIYEEPGRQREHFEAEFSA